MNVRCFDLLFPPGSLEGGKGTNNRWLQSIDLAREKRHVLIGSFLIPKDAPVLDDWWITGNLHVASGENGYDGNNSSPIQAPDISNGCTKVVTHGGGTWVDDANKQFHGVERHVFPIDGDPAVVWAKQPANVVGSWNDWVLDCYLVEKVGWFDFYLNGSLFASSKLLYPNGISTIYTGQSKVEAWTGSYYPTRPDDGPENIGKTGHLQVALTRHGGTPAEALVDVPVLYVDKQGKIGWGAGQLDLSVVTELPVRDPASWILPAALFPNAQQPPATPPTPPDPASGLDVLLAAALSRLRDDLGVADVALDAARKTLSDCNERRGNLAEKVAAVAKTIDILRLP